MLDLAQLSTGEWRIIELNPFAMTTGGSLYDWKLDGDLLRGDGGCGEAGARAAAESAVGAIGAVGGGQDQGLSASGCHGGDGAGTRSVMDAHEGELPQPLPDLRVHSAPLSGLGEFVVSEVLPALVGGQVDSGATDGGGGVEGGGGGGRRRGGSAEFPDPMIADPMTSPWDEFLQVEEDEKATRPCIMS